MERQLHTVKANGVKPKLVGFTIAPAGTGAPTLSMDRGDVVATVARSAQGILLVTMRDAVTNAPQIIPHAQVPGDATDLYAQLGDITSLNPLTFQIRLMTATTPTDISADANGLVHCLVFFDDSGAGS